MLPIYNIIIKYKEVAEVIDSKMAGYSRTGGRSSVTPDGTRRMRSLIKDLSMGIMPKFPFDRCRWIAFIHFLTVLEPKSLRMRF